MDEEQLQLEQSLPQMNELDDKLNQGNLLLVRRMLTDYNFADDAQRETLFHTRVQVKDKLAGVIICGGSWTNCVSTRLIEAAKLETIPHPKPYTLSWFNNNGEILVSRQVVVPFSLGRYKDEVLCDVVPMDAGEVLLGRPWQFDRRAIYDGYLNNYSFVKDGKKFRLTPLSLDEIRKDNARRKAFDEEKARAMQTNKEEKVPIATPNYNKVIDEAANATEGIAITKEVETIERIVDFNKGLEEEDNSKLENYKISTEEKLNHEDDILQEKVTSESQPLIPSVDSNKISSVYFTGSNQAAPMMIQVQTFTSTLKKRNGCLKDTDLRTNPFQEREDDVILKSHTKLLKHLFGYSKSWREKLLNKAAKGKDSSLDEPKYNCLMKMKQEEWRRKNPNPNQIRIARREVLILIEQECLFKEFYS